MSRLSETATRMITLLVAAFLAVAVQAGGDQGSSASAAGGDEEAVRELQETVRADPMDSDAHYQLGLALERLERHDQAVHHLRTAHDLAPNDLDVRLALGWSYVQAERPSKAHALLRSIDSEALAPSQRATLLRTRARVQLAIARYARAAELLGQAIDASDDPEEQREMWRLLGWIYERHLKKYTLAIDAYRQGADPDGMDRIKSCSDVPLADDESTAERIEAMREEARQLEAELRALQERSEPPP